MSTTQELVERLQNVSEWKQIIERHRRITDDPAISYVLKDGTRVHEDENVIAKLAASLSRALEGAADTASAAAERLSELERENARMRADGNFLVDRLTSFERDGDVRTDDGQRDWDCLIAPALSRFQAALAVRKIEINSLDT